MDREGGLSVTPNDSLTLGVAERRLNRRIDALERRLSEWKVECRVDARLDVVLPSKRHSGAGWLIAVLAITGLAQQVVIVLMAAN
jgi:hypothetical protein